VNKATPLLKYLPPLLWLYALVEFYPFHPGLLYLPAVLFGVGCLALLLIFPETRIVSRQTLRPMLFLSLWFIYNLASYAWARDGVEVMLYGLYILRYLALFIVFSKLFGQERQRRILPWFMFALVLLYVATAVWELATFRHLPTSRKYGDITYMPTGPFYNENNLAAFLLLFSPFLLFAPKLAPRKGWGYLSSVVVVFILILMTIQGARIAMLALGAFLGYYFLFQVKWRHKLVLAAALGLIVAGIWFGFRSQVLFVYKVLQYQTATLGSERSSVFMSSIQIRQQLLKESFGMSARTGFIGVGGGNFEPVMRSEAMYDTGMISNPHNYLMELFGNWGILILAAFAYLYLHWLLGLWRLYRSSEGRQRSQYLMYLCSLLLFLPASVLPSTIRWNYFLWIYFAGINAMLYAKPLGQEAPDSEERTPREDVPLAECLPVNT
jgi:O-antigen ligase